jgi:hypothetical protein
MADNSAFIESRPSGRLSGFCRRAKLATASGIAISEFSAVK